LEDVIKTANLLPVFSERLKAALDRGMVGGIQYLPVKVFDFKRASLGSYFLANVLNLVSAMDENRSGVRRERIQERDGTVKEWIHWINKIVLRGAELIAYDVVVIPGMENDTFVSRKFKVVFERSGFSGIGFVPVEVI